MWQIRWMIALVMLAICTYTDIRERNIYLIPLIISASGGMLITMEAFFMIPGYDAGMFVNELIIPILTGGTMILISKAIKRHIGIGDIYMLVALSLIIGTGYMLLAVVAGSAAASLFAGVTMIKGRRRFIRSIPFAPFVMSGFMIVMVNEIQR